MSDFRLGVQASAAPTQYVDNELVTYNDGTTQALRQRVRIGGASGTQLANVIADGSLQVSDARETVAGTITAVSQSVMLQPSGDNSSWSVQITGTWVGTMITEVTMDGTNWILVNSRQSNGGRLANNFSSNGLFRGVFGGMFAFRVRSTAWTSGTATVNIALGTSAAVFSNSDILILNQPQYYASSAGLNSMWGVSSPAVTLGNSNTEQPLMAITNTGTNPLYIYRISKGCNNTAVFRRYQTPQTSIGNAAATQMTVTGGTTLTSVNRAGAQTIATSATARYGTAMTVTNQPAVASKTMFVAANAQDSSTEEGSLIVQVGQTLLFTVSASVNSSLAAVEVVYWDGSTLT